MQKIVENNIIVLHFFVQEKSKNFLLNVLGIYIFLFQQFMMNYWFFPIILVIWDKGKGCERFLMKSHCKSFEVKLIKTTFRVLLLDIT